MCTDINDTYIEYLKKDEPYLDVDDIRYYKIIWHETVNLGGMIINSMLLPSELWKLWSSNIFADENGNKLIIKGPIHIRFNGYIPPWYIKELYCTVEYVEKAKPIGEWICCIGRR